MTKTIKRLTLTAVVVLSGLAAEPALAAVEVERAELDGSRLRLEGTATAARDIRVDGTVFGRSDSSGAFRFERNPFTPPADCTVDVNDGSATAAVVRLSPCTVSQPTPPPPGDSTAPTPPTGLTATLTGTTANLSWTASSDAVGVAGYRVSRNGSVLPGTVTGTAFADSGLSAGTYAYTVTAVDAAGNVSGASNTASVTIAASEPQPADTTAPSVPQNLTAVLSGGTIAELRWSPSTDNTGGSGVAGYRVTRNGVYRYTLLNPFDSDSNLPVGTYTYTVSAVDAAGNVSGESNSVSVTVPPPPAVDVTPPSVPVNLGTTVVGTTVSLGWDLSTDDTRVAGYTIRRNGTVIATTADTTYLNSGLAPGTYTYTVTAFDAAGNTSAQSAGTRNYLLEDLLKTILEFYKI